ncbi:MAG TPA: signal recognition particle protein [Gammaproteobacteria bacterium]|jgi:signal recognition particle subunit SRP54|nr:signal recognition particle protein [Gammaproteobacteria bacterium]
MFDQLTARLTAALQRVTGRGRITEENVRETVRAIRMALLEADVAVPVAKALVDRVRDRALGEEVARSLNPGQAFTKIVHDELVTVLGGDLRPIAPHGHPAVIMLVGLQGAGKTTTAAKLARSLLEQHGGAALLASTDVYRPAARAQLKKLAGDIGAGYFESDESSPAAIAEQALAAAQRGGQRWLIVDTAGRLHVDAQMMAEARELHAHLSPAETLFVVDSMAGQDAVNSARAFHEALPLTGVILTKTDGDARGGVALSVREVTGLPIKLVGTGEKVDALEPFVPARFAARILGLGDVVGLVEQVQRQLDVEEMERVADKVKKGREITLEDFRDQLRQIVNLGGFEQLLDKLPGVSSEQLAAAKFDPKQLKRQIGIIDAMTPRERRIPAIIDGSRKRRIAAGAGLPVQDVSRLLKQHKNLAKTMKQMRKAGGMQKLLGAMGHGGGPPLRGRR